MIDPAIAERYWHNKHPVVEQTYRGRPLPGGKGTLDIDVRHFIWPDDVILQRILRDNGMTPGKEHPDTAAHEIQKLIVKSLSYRSDELLGAEEYWLLPGEAWELKGFDCEDGANLMVSLILNAIPKEEHWRIRCAAGPVDDGQGNAGGHDYDTFCRTTDNEFVILDWCFFEDSSVAVSDKPLARTQLMYKTPWFSYNDKFAWAHQRFELCKRIRGYETRKAA